MFFTQESLPPSHTRWKPALQHSNREGKANRLLTENSTKILKMKNCIEWGLIKNISPEIWVFM